MARFKTMNNKLIPTSGGIPTNLVRSLEELMDELNAPTYTIGIGSSFDVKNQGYNEGQQAASKSLKKILRKFKLIP